MFRIALAFCAGAAALHALPAAWPPAAAIAVIAAAWALRRQPALAAGLAGFAWALIVAAGALATAWPCSRDGERVALEGVIAAPPLERDGRTDFEIEARLPPGSATQPRRLRLAWYDAEALPQPGERWRLTAKLRCPRGFANPGTPDRELALRRDGIDATGYVVGEEAPRRLEAPPARAVERLRARVAQAIAAALPPGPTVAVLQGLAVGVRGTIPNALWEAFAVTGVAHLIAISGLHVTGCAVCVLAVLRLTWRLPRLVLLRARVAVECVAVVSVTAAYAILSGASLPALRTLVMVGVFASLRLLRRSLPVHHSIGLAALVLVAGDPLALASTGFWLSFVATAALFTVLLQDGGWRARAFAFLRSQLAIFAVLAPVLAVSFGRLSLIAPVMNAVAVPLFSLAVLPAVLAGTALTLIAPGASAEIWQALAAVLEPAWPRLEALARWPLASFAPAAQALPFVTACGTLLFAVLLLPLAGLRIAAAVVLLALLAGRAERPAPGAFSLAVVDVGQGLAAVVETARHTLVFDTGPRWRGGAAAARVSLLPYLRARGIRRIDRLVLSHDDADHTGGAELLSDQLDVLRTLATPGSHAWTGSSCVAGDAWQWDGVVFRVLHPPPHFEGRDNDRSCAIRVAGPGGAALLLADPEAAAEAAMLAQPLAADVVLLPHHGSRSSSSAALVAAVQARLGIASAAFGNRWGLPHAEVAARWRESGAPVLDTAREGAIRVGFPARPGSFTVVTERRDRPRWWRAAPAD